MRERFSFGERPKDLQFLKRFEKPKIENRRRSFPMDFGPIEEEPIAGILSDETEFGVGLFSKITENTENGLLIF